MATKKQSSGKVAAEVGAGLLAAAAAASAGYYFYGSDKAKKHRAAATKWAQGMKADVLKETKKLKRIDQKQIGQIVDRAAAAYASARTANKAEVKAAATELKKNWQRVREEIAARAAGTKRAGSPVRKTAKKSAKKAVKKAAPKKASKKAVKKAPKKTAKATKKHSR